MELLNVVTARTIWLFDMNEINPTGKNVFPELIEWLKDQYHFEKYPSSVTDVDDSKGLAFSRGQFQAREEIFIAVELKIYTDGLVANTWSSTRDSDAFLVDVVDSAKRDFSLAFHANDVRKLYLSEVNVRSSINLPSLNPKLIEFSDKISKLTNHDFEFAGVSFWPRQSHPANNIPAFCLERKVKTDGAENKYYSRASFHTDNHLKIIEEMESAFTS